MIELKYIVVGTGRCGTVYTARVLSELGIPCSHEGIFTPRGIDEAVRRMQHGKGINNSTSSRRWGEWLKSPPEAEASYMAVPFLNHDSLRRARVIHLVRSPLEVVFSFLGSLKYFSDASADSPPDPWQAFIYDQLPELRKPMSSLERACSYYVRWNEMIHNAVAQCPREYLLHRIEDSIRPVLEFIDKPESAPKFSNRKANSSRSARGKEETFKNLPAGDIRDGLAAIAERYGYDIWSDRASPKLFV